MPEWQFRQDTAFCIAETQGKAIVRLSDAATIRRQCSLSPLGMMGAGGNPSIPPLKWGEQREPRDEPLGYRPKDHVVGRALRCHRRLAYPVPVGGVAFILGWVLLARTGL
jgi:hypothetical protein